MSGFRKAKAEQAALKIGIYGPPGCLHGDTLITDPVDGSIATVRDRFLNEQSFHVTSVNSDGLEVIGSASPPIRFDKSEMIKFTLINGRSITVTLGHLFWDGVCYVSAKQIARRLRVFGHVRLPSSSGNFRSTQIADARRSSQRALSYSGCCSQDSYRRDEQPLSYPDSDQAQTPQPSDVRLRSHCQLREDDQGEVCTNTSQPEFGHQSSTDCIAPSGHHFDAGSLLDFPPARSLSAFDLFRTCEHTPPLIHRMRILPEVSRYALVSMICDAFYFLLDTVRSNITRRTNDKTAIDIVKAESVESDNYYDFHVANWNNYLAEGCFHHNSGKTFTSLLVAEGLAAITNKRVAMVDTEHGSDFYCKTVPTRPYHPAAFDFDAIYTKSMADVLREVKGIDTSVHSVVIIDSVTHLWESCIGAYAGSQTRAGTIPMHAWGKIKKPYKELMAYLLSSPMHVLLCGRQGTEYATDAETDELRAIGVKMKAEGETPYEPHILIRMEAIKPKKTNEVATIIAYAEKDRTGVLSGRSFENPTFDSLCKPLLGLLGGTQAQVATSDEVAAHDAEAMQAEEIERLKRSTDILREWSAKVQLVATLDELKKLGKLITPQLKSKMIPYDVAKLRDSYQARESELSGGPRLVVDREQELASAE